MEYLFYKLDMLKFLFCQVMWQLELTHIADITSHIILFVVLSTIKSTSHLSALYCFQLWDISTYPLIQSRLRIYILEAVNTIIEIWVTSQHGVCVWPGYEMTIMCCCCAFVDPTKPVRWDRAWTSAWCTLHVPPLCLSFVYCSTCPCTKLSAPLQTIQAWETF